MATAGTGRGRRALYFLLTYAPHKRGRAENERERHENHGYLSRDGEPSVEYGQLRNGEEWERVAVGGAASVRVQFELRELMKEVKSAEGV